MALPLDADLDVFIPENLPFLMLLVQSCAPAQEKVGSEFQTRSWHSFS